MFQPLLPRTSRSGPAGRVIGCVKSFLSTKGARPHCQGILDGLTGTRPAGRKKGAAIAAAPFLHLLPAASERGFFPLTSYPLPPEERKIRVAPRHFKGHSPRSFSTSR